MGDLGDRMKGYEESARTVLPRRLPLILRIDGKAFHTWTRGCERPFDEKLGAAMFALAAELVEEIQGAQLAYTQSDEISILVNGYKRLTSQAWFDNQVQKMVSVAASMAAASMTVASAYIHGQTRKAHFDARAFVLPEAEVSNYFLWRQQDATRNSVQMLARSLYSHKQLEGKRTSELHEMCFAAGKNWNDLAPGWKRGRCVYRTAAGIVRDGEPPIFSDVREYIERHLLPELEVV